MKDAMSYSDNVKTLRKIYSQSLRPANDLVFKVEHKGRTLELRPGYYILPGTTGAGKTTTMGALVLTYLAAQIRADYFAMDEVGATTPTPFSDWNQWPSTANSPASKDNMPLPEARIGDNMKVYRNKLVDKMQPMSKGGVLCVDSMMGMYLSCAGLFKSPFMTGGLDGVYLAIGIMLSELAQEHNVALIGVLNNKVFPVPSLAGMTFGEMELMSPGSIAVKDRAARGSLIPFSVPEEFLDAARVALSGAKPDDKGEFKSSRSATSTFF